jgi:hypothetical protein
MQSTEIDNLFYFDPAAPRMIGYATAPSIVREDGAIAISITAELLDRANKQPSGKWLWLQVQPEDALVLVAAILALATTEGWPLQPNIVEAVDRFRLSDKPVTH